MLRTMMMVVTPRIEIVFPIVVQVVIRGEVLHVRQCEQRRSHDSIKILGTLSVGENTGL